MYPNLWPFLQVLTDFLRSITECAFASLDKFHPQQAGKQKSWTSVELLAWDTPVCIGPDLCQRSYCTQIMLGQGFFRNSMTFFYFYIL